MLAFPEIICYNKQAVGGIAQLGEQVTSKATRNRNAASKKLISRKSSKIKGFRFHGGIAQLGERMTGSHEVSGSIPLISTNFFIRSSEKLVSL